MDPLTPSGTDSSETGGGLPLSGWLLVVALVYATLEQGAFPGPPFRLVLLLLVIAAVALFAVDRKAIDRPLITALAAMAFGPIAVSVLMTGADLRSAAPTVGLAFAVLVAVAVGTSVTEAGVVRLVDGVIACGLVVSVTAWIGVAFHREPWALVAQGIWRGSSTLTYANATAALAGTAFVLALARLTRSTRPSAFLVAYGLGVGVACAGSRAAVLSVAVGVLVLARRAGWRETARVLVPLPVAALLAGLGLLPSISARAPARPGLAVGGLVLGAVVAVVLRPGRQRPGRRMATVLVLVAVGLGLASGMTESAIDDVRSARVDLHSADRADEWRAAAGAFVANPLFGVGPGQLDLSWVAADGRTMRAEFTHNEYLELLATQGLVGGGALIAAVLLVVNHRRSRPPRAEVEIGLGAAFAVLAVHSAFDFLWHIPLLVLVGGVLVGLLARTGADVTELAPEPDRQKVVAP